MDVIQEHNRNLALNLQRSLHNMTGVLNYDDGFHENIKVNYNILTMGHQLFQNSLHEIKNIRGEQLLETLKNY